MIKKNEEGKRDEEEIVDGIVYGCAGGMHADRLWR